MKWEILSDGTGAYARGRSRRVYLAATYTSAGGSRVAGVRLTWFPEAVPMHEPMAEALAVMRNTVVLPLGRGPGRPADEPEVAALVEMARAYAERFEAGESLPGLTGWQHPAKLRVGEGETVRFLDEPPLLHKHRRWTDPDPPGRQRHTLSGQDRIRREQDGQA
jgi:hypothetical protein